MSDEQIIERALTGTGLVHVEGAGRAHSEAFDAIRPASAMLVIAAIAAPGMVVEIEADAVIANGDSSM